MGLLSPGSEQPFYNLHSPNKNIMDTTNSRQRRNGTFSNQSRTSTQTRSRFSNTKRPSGSRNGKRGFNGGRRARPTFDVSKFINKNPSAPTEVVKYVPEHTFFEFGLDDRLTNIIKSSNLTDPTPIQDKIIPHIIDGRDVIGLANTGTGKTAAFLLPLIQKVLKNPNEQVLVLAPTRELAIQIEQELKNLSKQLQVYSVVCVGGANIHPQLLRLKRKNNFIIGTPGRVLDLVKRKAIRTENIRTVVLDEADRMLDMGFINDIRTILSQTPKDRHTLLFSATLPTEIEKLIHTFLREPVKISVKTGDITKNIEQDVVYVKGQDKLKILSDLLKKDGFHKVIVFGAMKHSVEKLCKDLNKCGHKAESIHGNKSHGQRQRSLSRFKGGEVQALIATDVAARGIHTDNVSHVINYDLPSTYEDYIHRIGRTGRGDKLGKALTFVD